MNKLILSFFGLLRSLFSGHICIGLFCFVQACSQFTAPNGQPEARLHSNFTNSVRDDGTRQEQKMVLRMPDCTAFLLENNASKHFMVTARHCAAYQAGEWCNSKVRVATQDGSAELVCAKIIVASPHSDVFVAEMNVVQGNVSAENTQPLFLPDFPLAQDELVMVGYPADSERKSKLTVTRNCSVQKLFIPPRATFALGYDDEAKKIYPWDLQLTDPLASHNCTTYGGNSGGPMVIKNSFIAVGMPNSYDPTFEPLVSTPDNGAWMVRLDSFVQEFREPLVAAGVEFAGRPSL